jgi:hypothetical protein
MWLVIHAADEHGRFYLAHPYFPKSWPGARLRIIGQHSDACEAHRIAAELEQRRLLARWRRLGFDVSSLSSPAAGAGGGI